MRKLARGIHNIKILTLCGGVSIGPQIGSLEHGAHIIVGIRKSLLIIKSEAEFKPKLSNHC